MFCIEAGEGESAGSERADRSGDSSGESKDTFKEYGDRPQESNDSREGKGPGTEDMRSLLRDPGEVDVSRPVDFGGLLNHP